MSWFQGSSALSIGLLQSWNTQSWDTGKDGGDDDDDQYNADDDADDDHNGKGDGDDYDGCNSDAIRQISSFHVKKSKNRENLKKTSWA